MASVADVNAALQRLAPERWALENDPVGLSVGTPSMEVTRAVVALDHSLGLISFAQRTGASLMVTHHPVGYVGFRSVTDETYSGRFLLAAVQANLALISAHTNWDAAPGGINDELAKRLGLQNVIAFGEGRPQSTMKATVYAPPEAVDQVLDAASAAGAGVLGFYERCAFFTPGTGTFRATPGANPSIGEVGKIETIPEVRLEFVLRSEIAGAVRRAVVDAHPYEEVPFELHAMAEQVEMPLGRIGDLPSPMPFRKFVQLADERLNTRSMAWGRDVLVARVGLAGGAAEGLWASAKRLGAQVFLTGEVRQHVAVEAAESDFGIVASGHYATEHPGCEALAARLSKAVPNVEFLIYTPTEGESGRPW